MRVLFGLRRTWFCLRGGVRGFAEAFESADEGEEFSPGAVLENVVEFAVVLEGGMEFHDEGVFALVLTSPESTRIYFSM